MVNLPESLYDQPSLSSSSVGRITAGGGVGPSTFGTDRFDSNGDPTSVTVEELILALNDAQTRERALHLLSKKMGTCQDMAILLWHSFGTVSSLLKEILDVYRFLYTSRLTDKASTRVCNALALFQCIASHPDTRKLFVKAKMPFYLFPFLNTENKERPHEYLRIMSLGVIGALVKANDIEVVHFLIKSEIFPYCIRCMRVGSEMSKSVATFIIQKLFMHEVGLKYCCSFAERFNAITNALRGMVELEGTSERLLKNIIICYLRLSEYPRACAGLRNRLPARLRETAFLNLFHDDPVTISFLQQLFTNVSNGHVARMQLQPTG